VISKFTILLSPLIQLLPHCELGLPLFASSLCLFHCIDIVNVTEARECVELYLHVIRGARDNCQTQRDTATCIRYVIPFTGKLPVTFTIEWVMDMETVSFQKWPWKWTAAAIGAGQCAKDTYPTDNSVVLETFKATVIHVDANWKLHYTDALSGCIERYHYRLVFGSYPVWILPWSPANLISVFLVIFSVPPGSANNLHSWQ
jgi:hypothetical protein